MSASHDNFKPELETFNFLDRLFTWFKTLQVLYKNELLCHHKKLVFQGILRDVKIIVFFQNDIHVQIYPRIPLKG